MSFKIIPSEYNATNISSDLLSTETILSTLNVFSKRSIFSSFLSTIFTSYANKLFIHGGSLTHASSVMADVISKLLSFPQSILSPTSPSKSYPPSILLPEL